MSAFAILEVFLDQGKYPVASKCRFAVSILFRKTNSKQFMELSGVSFVQYDQSMTAISLLKCFTFVQLQAENSLDGGMVFEYSIHSSVDGACDPSADDWKDTTNVSILEAWHTCTTNNPSKHNNKLNKYIVTKGRLFQSISNCFKLLSITACIFAYLHLATSVLTHTFWCHEFYVMSPYLWSL